MRLNHSHTTHRAESNYRILPILFVPERRDSMGRILLALINVAAAVLEEVFDED